MNKARIFIAIILFLLFTNIATIITILASNKDSQNADLQRPVIELPRDRRMDYFNSRIGVNPEQQRLVDNFSRQFNQKARDLSLNMRELRHQMVDEMASENPDTILLNEIAAGFGILHKEMKLLTMQYYFNLKSVSDKEQRERLHFIFRDMLDPDGNIYGRGRGGHGRGLRRGGGRIQRDLEIE